MKHNIENEPIKAVLGKTVYLKTYDDRGIVLPIPGRRTVLSIKMNRDKMVAELFNERTKRQENRPLEDLCLDKEDVQDDILIELARTKMKNINMEYYEKENGLKMAANVNFALTDWIVKGQAFHKNQPINDIEDIKKITGEKDNVTVSITISGTFMGRCLSLPVGDWNVVANTWHDGDDMNSPCGFLHLKIE